MAERVTKDLAPEDWNGDLTITLPIRTLQRLHSTPTAASAALSSAPPWSGRWRRPTPPRSTRPSRTMSMPPSEASRVAELRARIRAQVRASRQCQGLGPHITDTSVLDRLAGWVLEPATEAHDHAEPRPAPPGDGSAPGQGQGKAGFRQRGRRAHRSPPGRGSALATQQPRDTCRGRCNATDPYHRKG